MKNIRKIIISILVGVIAVSSFFLLASCKEEPEHPERRFVETETLFRMDLVTSELKGLPLFLVGDEEECYLKLRPDGTATLKIMTAVDLASANSLLGDLGSFSEAEVEAFINMIEGYFPGLDFTDLNTVIHVFEATLGLKLIGLDPNNAQLQSMFTYIATERKLPEKIEFPEGTILGLEINAPYYIMDVYSNHLDITRTGIFMGRHHEDGEAFLVLELRTNEEGKQVVNMDYQALDVHLDFIKD